jgi:hypothetical protein
MRARLSMAFALFLALAVLASSLAACRNQTPSPAPASPSPVAPSQTPTLAPSPTPQPALPAAAPLFRGDLAHTGVYAEQGDFGEWTFAAKGPIAVSPVLAGDSLYIGSMIGSDFYALDPSTHQVRWQKDDLVGLFASPAVTQDRVVVATLGGKVVALESATGKEVWSFTGSGPFRLSPSIWTAVPSAGASRRAT